MEKLISKKIAMLNRISIDVIRDENNASIVKKFTEESIKVLDADFGFALGKFDSDTLEIVYKSSHTPSDIVIPKKIKDHSTERGNILFDYNVKGKNYEPGIVDYLKSYIIIPIRYGNHIFGSIFLGYKKEHNFTEEELTLAETIENIVSRAVNTNWLIEREQKSLALAEKQKSTEVLLLQEKLKTEFMANATHELRTPLAIMKGNVDLALMEKANSKSVRENLEKVNVEIDILSDILKDLALITSSGQNINHIIKKNPVNITELINNLVKRLRTIALEKNIKIKVKSKKNKDLFSAGDEKYLEKLFINLMKNAITYGKNDGNIVIDLSTEKKTVKIKISDDGIGISRDDLPKIFDRFYRGDQAHTNSYGNHTGLGLAIARWAGELHGGKIDVESILDKGSTFTVTLPRFLKM